MAMSAQTCQHRDLIALLLWNTELVQDSKLILYASTWQAQHRPFAMQSVIKDTNIVFLLLIRLYLSWYVDESYFDSITLQNSVKLAKCQCDKDTNRNDCSSWNRWKWCVVLVMLFRQQHTVCVWQNLTSNTYYFAHPSSFMVCCWLTETFLLALAILKLHSEQCFLLLNTYLLNNSIFTAFSIGKKALDTMDSYRPWDHMKSLSHYDVGTLSWCHWVLWQLECEAKALNSGVGVCWG